VTERAGAQEFVDLHMHSTASDGSRSPADVVRAASAAGLSAIALTDHDSVSGLREAALVGEEMGVRIVNGVELSAVEGDSETHLLGLHLQDVDALHRRLDDLRSMRVRRAEQIVTKLNATGVTIQMSDVLEYSGDGAIGRPHVARALIAHGWAADARDAFDRYLGTGKPGYVAKEPLRMSSAIAMIHDVGGLAVLAHPGAGGTRERVTSLAAMGLDGLEVKHPGHSPSDTTRLRTLCEQLGLVASGGSDWHGAEEGSRMIGCMQVPADWLTRQDAKLQARGRAPAA
jgi:predicted metal-dependent phosphoesterase TrpH